jgi:enoyl-CoA hydratase/carnithine racemase
MQHWKLEINEKLATLTLITGMKGNRLVENVFVELDSLLRDLDLKEIRGLILAADGDNFSQGFDLSFLLASKDYEDDTINSIFSICNSALDRLFNLPIPTMSLVSGFCIGGGFLMALATDFRVAHTNCRFVFPEVKQSLVVNLGLQRVYQLLGESRTKELVLFGKPLSSKKLMEWGIVNWITDEYDFSSHIQRFKKHILSVPPLAYSANKKLIQNLSSLTKEECELLENSLQKKMFQSSDFKEAIQSFLEKRKAIFKGK